ncbi:PAS domain-containing protein [Bacillus lacus]|uniref:PAS domain-containing protein n=1 Tax=Metabacillus lacus TaxID=1983721 RepID=A0A7X2J0W0_9BACI|nr:PAS domain-containing protein [Metabacillus lacus]MRX73062.1 PAS domain-containing protein [Metabacillus lacus]
MEWLPVGILDELNSAVLAIDTSYRITYMNPASEKLLQVDKNDALGISMYDFFPEAPEDYRHVENTVKYQREIVLEAVPLRWGKYNKYLNVQTHLIRQNGGNQPGVL